jgi:hypothetical protein
MAGGIARDWAEASVTILSNGRSNVGIKVKKAASVIVVISIGVHILLCDAASGAARQSLMLY